MSNGITPVSPLGDSERILSQAPISRDRIVTKQSQSPASQLKTVQTLMIVDGTDVQQDVTRRDDIFSQFAKYTLERAQLVRVNSWEEFLNTLQKYESIDRLVIYSHSVPGTIGIAGEFKNLSTLAQEYKGKRLPRITGQIDFEGCDVGERSEEIVPFLRLFNAPLATAWNWFHVEAPLSITVTADDNEESVRSRLDRYKDLLLPNSPKPSVLAKKPGNYVLQTEWFREDINSEKLPSPPNPIDTEMRFRPRKNAKVRKITSDETEKLSEEYRNLPVMPLEHIFIRMLKEPRVEYSD